MGQPRFDVAVKRNLGLTYGRMNEAQGKAPDQCPDASVWVDQHGDYLFKYAVFRLRL